MPKSKPVKKVHHFGASSVHAARLKIAEQLDLPLGAVRLVLPGGRPQMAIGGMELQLSGRQVVAAASG